MDAVGFPSALSSPVVVTLDGHATGFWKHTLSSMGTMTMSDQSLLATHLLTAANPSTGLHIAPMPKVPLVFDPGWGFWRVQKMVRFWDESTTADLVQATQSLTQGIRFPFAWAMLQRRGRLTAGWTAPKTAALDHALDGFYPDLDLSSVTEGLAAHLHDMPPFQAALLIRARPTVPARQVPQDSSKKETFGDALVRGLQGEEFLYLVIAVPVSAEETQKMLREAYALEMETRARLLRPGTALEKNHPAGQHMVSLLQGFEERLKEGLLCGLWQVFAGLFLADNKIVGAASGLLRGHFLTDRAVSFDLHLCSAHGPSAQSAAPPPWSILNGRELAALVTPPAHECPGYPVRPRPLFHTHMDEVGERPIVLGRLVHRLNEAAFFPVHRLTTHMLIAGTTGSGKTTTCLSILIQAWRRHRVPFVILETADKSEYAQKLRLVFGDDIAVFTVGDETRAPLHLDVLAVPHGVSVEAHIGYMMRIFKAAFPLPPPTPFILEEALFLFYQRKGWDVARNQKVGRDLGVTFDDLIHIIGELLHTKYAGYESQTLGTIRSALLARLETLTRGGRRGLFLKGTHEPSWRNLMAKPVVLEFRALQEPEIKSLAVLFLLYRLMAHAKQDMVSNPGRLHLTVVEEAHRVLKNREASSHPDAVNVQAAVVEEFANALAEVRYAGEGLLILDQQPSLLSPSVRANTNMRIYHRLSGGDEQTACANDVGMNEDQKAILSRLALGEALWMPGDGTMLHIRVEAS